MKKTVAEKIADYKRTGDPIVIMWDGKVSGNLDISLQSKTSDSECYL